MKFKKSIFSFIAVLLIATLYTQVSSALSFQGFFANPSDKDINWFVYELNPGDTIKDSFIITNSKNSTQSFYVYPADLATSSDGGFAIKQRPEEMTDIGKWITLDRTEVTLAPQSTQLVNFTLQVPKDEKIDVGEHAGGIAIEEIPQDSTNKQQGITIHKRVGLRVYVTIPGDIIKEVEYESFSKNISKFRSFIIPKTYKFSVIVNNIGNVSNNIDIKFNAKNLLTHKDNFQQYGQLLTRETRGVNNFNWKAPFFGIYNFSVEGTYQTMEGVETFKTDSLFGVIIPWDLVILIILVCIIICLGIKKHKSLYSGKGWQKYIVKKTDSLLDLAEKHSITWKQIVVVNKIKPPYIIEEGEVIRLPK